MMLVKMLMKMKPAMIRGMLVMMMAPISPSRREVSPTESLRRRSKVLLPKFRLETVAHHPKSLLLIFLGQMCLYTRKWGPEECQGPHKLRRRAQGGRACPQACGCLVGPLLVILSPVFFIYSKIILHEISAHFETCRIGILT